MECLVQVETVLNGRRRGRRRRRGELWFGRAVVEDLILHMQSAPGIAWAEKRPSQKEWDGPRIRLIPHVIGSRACSHPKKGRREANR